MKKILKFSLGCFALLIVALAVLVAATWAPDQTVESLKARWAAPNSLFLPIQGMQAHLRDEGLKDDPCPLVLVHGTSASLHTWDGWTERLRTSRRVIRFDLPGFGLTGPAPDNDYTMSRYVRFVQAILDQMQVEHCVLAGNSLGGEIAWQTALAQPGRIEKLILVAAAGYPFTAASVPVGFRLARTPLLSLLVEKILPRFVIEASVRNVYGDPSKVTPELVDRYYELSLREGNRRALVQRFQQAAWGPDAARIRELKQPTLILWGGRDQLIPPDNARRFHEDIPGSRMVIFDDLGHVPHEEDPSRTVTAALEFLGGNP